MYFKKGLKVKILKVEDLIKEVQKFDQNAEIVIEDSFTGCEDIIIDSQSDNLMVILTSSAENRYQKDLDEDNQDYDDDSIPVDIMNLMFFITKIVLFMALWIFILKTAWTS